MKILYYLFFISMFLTGCAVQKQHPQRTLSPKGFCAFNNCITCHRPLSPIIKQAITGGLIKKGMDKSAIENLFGPPEKKHILESGLMEIWFYDNSHFAFVFDKNNKLIKFFTPKNLNLNNNISK